MPTVIDSLVVELGLDPKNLTKGQQEALSSFQRFQDQSLRHAKTTEASAGHMTDALSKLKVQAIGVAAALVGASTFVEFVSGTIAAGASVGRLSRAIGVSAVEISKWQGVARQFGSTGENMAASFQSLSNAFTAWQVGGPEAPGIMQIFRAINTEAERLDKNNSKVIDSTKGVQQSLLDLADNLKIIHSLGPANEASYLAGKIPNLDAGLFDALIQGSQKFKENLKEINGWTDAEAEAAGRLQRRWEELKVKSENITLHMMFGAIDYLHQAWDWQVSGGKRSETFTKPSVNSQQITDPQKAAYRAAIASIESRGSGGYAAVGPVTRSGDRAYGKYQVMGDNIGPWSQAALGKTLSPQEFLASPESQDAIFDYKFGEYIKKFGTPQDAASAWFTGKPVSGGSGRHDVLGTSGASYVQQFNAGLSAGAQTTTSTTTTVAINGPITINAGPNASAAEIASKLRDLGLRRQAENNQSSVGAH